MNFPSKLPWAALKNHNKNKGGKNTAGEQEASVVATTTELLSAQAKN